MVVFGAADGRVAVLVELASGTSAVEAGVLVEGGMENLLAMALALAF